MTRGEMEAIVAGVATKSEKIRLLNRAGAKKADIARFLEIRYQHVYNVLKDQGGRDSPAELEPSADASQIFRLRIQAGQKVQLPPGFIEAEGLQPGDDLICRRDADGIKIMSRASAQEHLRAILRKRLPEQADLLEAVLMSDGRR